MMLTWLLITQSNLQTIAVISVAQGVVQFGSTQKVSIRTVDEIIFHLHAFIDLKRLFCYVQMSQIAY
jgi:hypothetical protein